MSLYEQIISLSRPYFGIGTERFISRQCSAHLDVTAENLSPQNLNELGKWIEISGGLVMPKEKATELKNKIIALAKQPTF